MLCGNPLDALRDVEADMAVCWLGKDGWLLSAGGLLLAFDLDLAPGGLRLSDPVLTGADVATVLDVHFITHEHGDHFNAPTCHALLEGGDCLFVLPASTTGKASEIGIPESRLRVARPGESFELPGLGVRPLHALHGHKRFSIYEGANMQDCGYLLTVADRTVLRPGDTALLSEHLQLGHVDVLLVSPTGHNMHVDRSAILIDALRPDHVFPQHFGTYRRTEENEFWTQGYPDELREGLSVKMRDRYHKLEQGQVFVIP